MRWRRRRRAHVAPLVIVEPSKFGPDAVLVIECPQPITDKAAADLISRATATFKMKVAVLDAGAKVARLEVAPLPPPTSNRRRALPKWTLR